MLNKKHEEIQHKINKLQKTAPDNNRNKISSNPFNIAIDLLSYAIVGVVTGLFFDNLFDSKPIFLIMCLLIAMIASFWSIWNKYIKNNGS